MKGRERLRAWLRAVRVPFLSAAGISVLVGTAVAWYERGIFDPFLFILTFTGALLIHAGTDLFNEYFDYISGNDQINEYRHLPFNGGTGVILDGQLSPGEVRWGGIICYALGGVIGIYLTAKSGLLILALGMVGLFSGYFYVGEPLKFAYRGVGELSVGCNFGLFIIMGSYYVQARVISPMVVVTALPITLLIAAVLYINEFPDYDADRLVGKANLVVRLGRRRAVAGYYLLIALAYGVIFVSVPLGLMPPVTFASVVTLPIAAKACSLLRRYYERPLELVPANAATVQTHLLVGLAFSLGFMIMGFF